MPYPILWIITAAFLSLSAVSAQTGPLIIVAWVETGDLWVWQQGDTAPIKLVRGNVVMPYIGPNADHIAFTRGEELPAELWSVEVETGILREFTLPAPSPDAQLLVDHVEWFDADTLYFNTRLTMGPFLERQDDLWQANIATGEVQRVLAAGQGGTFFFSPDHQHIALVRSGVYDGQDGSISLLDLSDLARRELLSFPAISTGSEYAFYPLPLWNESSSALWVSIPPKELIYVDNSTLLITVWQLAIDGTSTTLAAVKSSFFGLPQMSFNGQYMTYMRRTGDLSSNQFELVVANTNNNHPTAYATGSAGTISGATWLPSANQFFYAQGDIGDYWLGTPGQQPQPFPEKMYYPHFIDSSNYVYATYPGDPYELRFARTDDSTAEFIASFTNPAPVFDASLIP